MWPCPAANYTTLWIILTASIIALIIEAIIIIRICKRKD